MTWSLTELANHLVELGVQRVVMEATSDYWRPVFYLFEAHGLQPWLVNARDVKAPARPTQDRRTGRGLAVQSRRTPDAAVRVSCRPDRSASYAI
jgi:transposase